MVIDRILNELPPGTVIPKPSAERLFTMTGEGTVRGEGGVFYTIPNRKNPNKLRQKGIAGSQLEKAFRHLQQTGKLTKKWWNENVRHSDNEGGCNFTTVGGLLALLGEAEYSERGVYAYRESPPT
jgi:hypothetical protein